MNRQPGNILLTVLWIIVALVVLTLGLVSEASLDTERTQLQKERAQAYWYARSGIEQTKAIFAANKTRAEEEFQIQSLYEHLFDRGGAFCVLESQASRMSVNSKDQEMWLQLFKLYGKTEEEALVLIEAILDWTDPDDDMNPNGAESAYYQSLTPPYFPRNGVFLSVEELLLVRGITEEMFFGTTIDGQQVPGLQEVLGMTPSTLRKFDINSCSEEILMAFLELPREEVTPLVEARTEKRFESIPEAGQLLDLTKVALLEKFFTVSGGDQFKIRSTGFLNHSPVRYTMVEEVRYTGGPSVFRILSHQDFSTDHIEAKGMSEQAHEELP